MQIKIFQIPSGDSGVLEGEMNEFLRGHRILSVREELVSGTEGTFWCFCIKYLEGISGKGVKQNRIDYREKLSPEAFRVFVDLKQCRKDIAEELKLKVYMVFTNEELAKMTEFEELTLENMAKIRGIGEKKLKQYGVPLLEKYEQMKGDEADR